MGNSSTACSCGRKEGEPDVVHEQPQKKKKGSKKKGGDDVAQFDDTSSIASGSSVGSKSSKKKSSSKSKKGGGNGSNTTTPSSATTRVAVSPIITDEKALKPGGTVIDVGPLIPAFRLLNEGQTFTRYTLPSGTTATKLADGTYQWDDELFREEQIFLWWEPDTRLGTLYWCSPPPPAGERPQKQPYQEMRVHHISDIVSKLAVLPGGVEPVAAFPRRVQIEACISAIDRSKSQLRLMAPQRGNLAASDVRMNWFKALRAVRGSGGQAARVTQSPAPPSHRNVTTVETPRNGGSVPTTPAAASYPTVNTPSLSNSGLAAHASANSGNTSSAPSSIGVVISPTPNTVQRSLVEAATVEVSNPPPHTPPTPVPNGDAAGAAPKVKKGKGKKK